jgi:hypothetical protein
MPFLDHWKGFFSGIDRPRCIALPAENHRKRIRDSVLIIDNQNPYFRAQGNLFPRTHERWSSRSRPLSLWLTLGPVSMRTITGDVMYITSGRSPRPGNPAPCSAKRQCHVRCSNAWNRPPGQFRRAEYRGRGTQSSPSGRVSSLVRRLRARSRIRATSVASNFVTCWSISRSSESKSRTREAGRNPR